MKATSKIIITISIFLISCTREKQGSDSNNSGLIYSIISYAGDSALLQYQYQSFFFTYDDLQRVIKVSRGSENLTTSTQASMMFYYEGQSKSPYLMIDSTIATPQSGSSITKTHFYYDPAGKKIKDSTYKYWRSGSDPTHITYQPLNQHFVNVYTYSSQYDTRRVIKGLGIGIYTDTMYYGSNNDYQYMREGVYHLALDTFDYYDIPNPSKELNISHAMQNIWDYTGLNFHPFIYDMNKANHLPKTIKSRYYSATDNQKIKVDFYYEKNASDKIIKLVSPKRRNYFPSGNSIEFYYSNYAFSYYP